MKITDAIAFINLTYVFQVRIKKTPCSLNGNWKLSKILKNIPAHLPSQSQKMKHQKDYAVVNLLKFWKKNKKKEKTFKPRKITLSNGDKR